jgi:hypothetical protein
MTSDQLEHDLKTLAAPRADDEHLRLAIRATLGEHLRVRPERRHRTRLALGAAAVSAATVAAAIVALVGSGGSGGPASADAAILAHAARAISPPANLIVHVKETGVDQDGKRVAIEWWQETNPPYTIRLIKGPVGEEVEGAADGTTSLQYEAATNTIHRHPDSTSPTLFDPVEIVRAELIAGTAQVVGTVTIDGQPFYRIDLPGGAVGYFDQTDYRPVYLDNPQTDGSIVRTHVITYEELSLTPENAQLLSVTAQHPNASVETSPAPIKQR